MSGAVRIGAGAVKRSREVFVPPGPRLGRDSHQVLRRDRRGLTQAAVGSLLLAAQPGRIYQICRLLRFQPGASDLGSSCRFRSEGLWLVKGELTVVFFKGGLAPAILW